MGSRSEGIRRGFSPRRLRMARDLAGVSQAGLGEAAGVTAASVSLYERGAATPTEETLAGFANRLGVDVAFFHASAVQVEAPAFFRSLRAASALERRRARHKTEVVHELVETLETEVRLPDLDLLRLPVEEGQDGGPAGAARLTRESWGMRPGPIENVVRLVERHGVVVARPSSGDDRIDAYSVGFAGRPVIVMSSAKGKRDRSRFDVAHELGHLVMHDPAQAMTRWVENQAHEFAAEFLMPEQDIREELREAGSFENLLRLKRKWGVSLAALIRRQRDLDIIEPARYTSLMKSLSARGWRRNEPGDLGEPEAPILLKKAMEVAGLAEHDLAQRTGYPIRLVRDVLDTLVDSRPLVEI